MTDEKKALYLNLFLQNKDFYKWVVALGFCYKYDKIRFLSLLKQHYDRL